MNVFIGSYVKAGFTRFPALCCMCLFSKLLVMPRPLASGSDFLWSHCFTNGVVGNPLLAELWEHKQ